MTASETKGREFIKKWWPGSIIAKIPDFKQTSNVSMQGYPDFLVTHNGLFFVEIKMVKGYKITASDFTPAQIALFPKLMQKNAKIWLVTYFGKKSTLDIFELPKTFDSTFSRSFECADTNFPISLKS